MDTSNLDSTILRQLVDSIPQYLWWKDLNSEFIGCNDKFAKYFGFTGHSDMIGISDYDLFGKEKTDAEFVRKIDNEIIKTGKPKMNFEEQLTMPGIGKRWLSTSKIPWYDGEEIKGTIGWFYDITEFKEMQIQIDVKNKALVEYSLQLKKTNNELELANFDLEKFTYATSHDLKGPVLTMELFAELLLEKSHEYNEETLKYIEIIHKSSRRMVSLIDGILNFAKSGTKELIREDVDIQQLVSDKVSDLTSIIKERSAIVNVNLPKGTIKAYSKLIGLVFYNLINNGIKFNSSQAPMIDCNYTETDDKWIFSIEDNGVGIDSDHLNKIFLPFTRMNQMNVEGSGIGLSICKRVVVLHEGEIWVEESKPGKTVMKFSVSK